MNSPRRSAWVAFAVVLYCLWQSRAILGAWRAAPLDRLGWVALILWLAPLAWLWRAQLVRRAGDASLALLAVGLGLAFVGTLGEVNALRYAGLACALAGTTAWHCRRLPWLLAAVSWMPVFGYFLSRFSPDLILPARLCLAALAAIWFWYATRQTAAPPSPS